MEIQLNDYHKKVNAQKMASMAYCREHHFAIRRNSTPLSKTLFTLHRKDINICNLETCTGEELTPLFTTLHPLFTRSRLPENLCKSVKSVGHKKVVSAHDRTGRASVSIPCAIWRWRVGEGWWRVSATLHLSHPQCLSGFQPIWWRVKGKKESGCFTTSGHIVLCLAMADYGPSNGRLLP